MSHCSDPIHVESTFDFFFFFFHCVWQSLNHEDWQMGNKFQQKFTLNCSFCMKSPKSQFWGCLTANLNPLQGPTHSFGPITNTHPEQDLAMSGFKNIITSTTISTISDPNASQIWNSSTHFIVHKYTCWFCITQYLGFAQSSCTVSDHQLHALLVQKLGSSQPSSTSCMLPPILRQSLHISCDSLSPQSDSPVPAKVMWNNVHEEDIKLIRASLTSNTTVSVGKLLDLVSAVQN